MKHRLFSVLAGLSLLLFVATVVLWSCRFHHVLLSVGHIAVVGEGSGFALIHHSIWPAEYLVFNPQSYADMLVGTWTTGTGMARGSDGQIRPFREDSVELFNWFLTLLFALLPTAWAIWFRFAIRHRHRAVHGLCLACGYDLRATAARCPECGSVRRR